jgi:hypothetical protein
MTHPLSPCLSRRTVECHLDGHGFDVSVVASTDQAAISIARGTLIHAQHEADRLDAARATFAVVQVEPLDASLHITTRGAVVVLALAAAVAACPTTGATR